MLPTQMQQLCQYEDQKTKVQQLCLPLYEKQLFCSHGPKLAMSQTNMLQQIERRQSEPYLSQLEQSQQKLPQSHHTPSQGSQDYPELFNGTLITDVGPMFFHKCQRRSLYEEEIIIEKSEQSVREKKQIQQPENTQQCKICYCDVEKDLFEKPLSCQHEFCRECLINHITQCIQRAAVLQIQCPEAGCEKLFSEEIIQDYVTETNFRKYKKFYHRQIISQNKNVRWCPKPDCEHYVVGNGDELLICQCGQEICFKCGNNYHKGLNCNDAMNHQYLQAKKDNQIHDCPNCKAPILKKGGCNHMTCYACRHQFCWICKGKYSSYHYVIFNIFGCVFPGGQGANIQPLKNPMLLRIMMIIPKIILTLLMIALLLVVLPFIGLYGIIIAPYQIAKNQCGFRFYRYSGCAQFGFGLLFFFLGVILSPLTVGITILISPCILMYYLVEYL